MRHNTRGILALLLALALVLPSCGSKPAAAAATMHLRKTEGTVGVSDGDGKGVEPREDLGLYSGYGVDTSSESFAWIDLDEVKLTKMDQDSQIAITKEGKKLEIEVKSGSLFFNVTQPLAEDETMELRTSSMVVGIRGTCGWVEAVDETTMRVGLLEGQVECSVGENTAAVSAGEMGILFSNGEIMTVPLTQEIIPAFVMEEIAGRPALLEGIQPTEHLDDEPAGSTPAEPVEPASGGEPSYTYDYNDRGRISQLNVWKADGELDYYYTFDYVNGWIEVESYMADGSLDGWVSYETTDAFYAAFQDMLPPDYTP